jgi:hypothetical protein
MVEPTVCPTPPKEDKVDTSLAEAPMTQALVLLMMTSTF